MTPNEVQRVTEAERARDLYLRTLREVVRQWDDPTSHLMRAGFIGALARARLVLASAPKESK